ncbi:TetR/AcrR family transcriptional regulator [Streptomyces sp. STCH 565 A]|uniref:TetR/AcrR family transcriptional regulator n=1 Tax=Streptomyces sp. STCH 565 A TaxID=2950532 RepID=UPI00207661D5|nr:TetR/AcrR family transcriptional regulator [Streptomyces sp. STCH 565 A]MCM8554292.1 TetR/AcrR family transcriptional regulator [Streptomyces sp. STCH 565 A]
MRAGAADTPTDRPPARAQIIRAAADLLMAEGREAVSTRAVAAAAGVQPPAIYRLFGDKQGLLDALCEFGFHTYLKEKHALQRTEDPMADLRRAWDTHVEFGLAEPAFYSLMFSPEQVGQRSAGVRAAVDALSDLIHRVAATGQLVMSVERATTLVYSCGIGVVFTLLSTPQDMRDAQLSRDSRESVLATITNAQHTSAAPPELAGRATALAAALRDLGAPDRLSAAEQALLLEWLNRLADGRAAA